MSENTSRDELVGLVAKAIHEADKDTLGYERRYPNIEGVDIDDPYWKLYLTHADAAIAAMLPQLGASWRWGHDTGFGDGHEAGCAAMQPEIDAAYERGFAAGQGSRTTLDDRLAEAHPEVFVDTMRPFINWKGEPYWCVQLRRPKGPTKTHTAFVSYGEGKSAQEAFDAAIAAARETGGQGR